MRTLASLVLLLPLLLLTSTPVSALLPLSDLEQSLQDAFQNAGMGDEARFGVFVADAQTGERMAVLNEVEGMSPASLVKLFTVSAALDRLGPAHTFRTTVDIAGDISPDGRLYGQILIRGGGDPAFGPRFQDDRMDVTRILRLWARDLRALGIRSFDGLVIGDERRFVGDSLARGWDPVERGEWWSAEVSALTINDGCIAVQWDANRRVGSNARYTLIPDTDYIQFTPSVQVVASDQPYTPLRYFRHATRAEQVARGNIPQGMRLLGWTAVEDPARFTAQLFAEEMRNAKIKGEFRGVSTRGYPDGRLPDDGELREVLAYSSPPLSSYLGDILADSQNLYAESVARAVAIATGQPASFDGAANSITEWARGKGMVRGGFALMDGSGLSTLNMLPPRSVADLLVYQRENRGNGRLFRDSLSIAGETGTLRQRLEGLSGRFRGKTGVLKEATTLAGYLRLVGGRDFVVVLMIDESTAPVATRERFLDSVVQELDVRLSPTMTASR